MLTIQFDAEVFILKIKWKPLIISFFATFGLAFISSLFSMGSKEFYENINLPSLSPPNEAFAIVWSILYTLMAISAYMILSSKSVRKKDAMVIYFSQLLVNITWSILFFVFKAFLLSSLWLILLVLLVIVMIVKFYKIKPIAGYLQIPYLLWAIFAGYLNISIYFLN